MPVRRACGSCRRFGHCGRNLSHKAVVPPTQLGAFSQDQLVEDVRQLAEIIENTRSDDSIRRVCRIAFPRRLQRLLEGIPAEWMARDEFVPSLGRGRAACRTGPAPGAPAGGKTQFALSAESCYTCGITSRSDARANGVARAVSSIDLKRARQLTLAWRLVLF